MRLETKKSENISYSQHFSGVPSQCNKRERKETKDTKNKNEKATIYRFYT